MNSDDEAPEIVTLSLSKLTAFERRKSEHIAGASSKASAKELRRARDRLLKDQNTAKKSQGAPAPLSAAILESLTERNMEEEGKGHASQKQRSARGDVVGEKSAGRRRKAPVLPLSKAGGHRIINLSSKALKHPDVRLTSLMEKLKHDHFYGSKIARSPSILASRRIGANGMFLSSIRK